MGKIMIGAVCIFALWEAITFIREEQMKRKKSQSEIRKHDEAVLAQHKNGKNHAA